MTSFIESTNATLWTELQTCFSTLAKAENGPAKDLGDTCDDTGMKTMECGPLKAKLGKPGKNSNLARCSKGE